LDRNRNALLGLLVNRGPRPLLRSPFSRAHTRASGVGRPHRDPSRQGDQSAGGRFPRGRLHAWAVVGTFGDNFEARARRAAGPLGLDATQLSDPARARSLHQLQCLRGPDPEPASRAGRPVPAPATLSRPPGIRRRGSNLPDPPRRLRRGHGANAGLEAGARGGRYALYVLPAEPWVRRASGVLANRLAQATTQRAHALLTRLPEGGFVVSVRAPTAVGTGADTLYRRFATGGSRRRYRSPPRRRLRRVCPAVHRRLPSALKSTELDSNRPPPHTFCSFKRP